MARRADPTPGHQRLLGLAAVAGLSVATALAFGRVFAGRAPTLQLVAAALASVAIAALFERRGLLLATLASLAGLAFAITWIVLPQTAWYGLPSIRTLRAVGRSLEFVGQQARVRVAPTPPLPPLMLAAVTAVWTAAFSSHALAIRAGSPLLAVLPPIALVGFADTVLEDGARPIYAIVLLAAAMAVVFADGLRRVRQWGPVWSGSRTRRLGPSVRGSRPVALTVIAAAVLVPGLLRGSARIPSSTFRPLVTRVRGSTRSSRSTRNSTSRRSATCSRSRPPTLSTGGCHARRVRRRGVAEQRPGRIGGGQTVTVPTVLPQPLGYAPPPTPRPTAVHVPGPHATSTRRTRCRWRRRRRRSPPGDLGDVTWDPSRGQAFVDGGLDAGLEYGITSRIVVPTAEELDQVVNLTPVQYGRWTDLPGTSARSADRADRERMDGRRDLGLRQGPRDPAALPLRRVPLRAPTSRSPTTPTPCSRS